MSVVFFELENKPEPTTLELGSTPCTETWDLCEITCDRTAHKHAACQGGTGSNGENGGEVARL